MSKTALPKRLQLSRKKGYRLQEASQALNGLPAIKIDRTSRWGNPFLVEVLGRRAAIDAFRRLVTGAMTDAEIRSHAGSGPTRVENAQQLRLVRETVQSDIAEL